MGGGTTISDCLQSISIDTMDIRILMRAEHGEDFSFEKPSNDDEWRIYYEEQSTDCLLFFLNNYWKTNWIVVEILKERGLDSKSWEEVVRKQQETKRGLELKSTKELSGFIRRGRRLKEIGIACEILEERGVEKKRLDKLITRGVEQALNSPSPSRFRRGLYVIIGGLITLSVVAIYVINKTTRFDWDPILATIGVCIFYVWLFFCFSSRNKNE